MGSEYELVRYEPHRKGEIVELQKHLWSSSTELNTAYFAWKYEKNPYLKEPLIYLALHDGKVVGMRGMSGLCWEAGPDARRSVGLYADDAVIAPEHRNRGLMPKIMKAAFADLATREYDFLFNLSAGSMTYLTSMSMGWRSGGFSRPMRWRPRSAAVPAGVRLLAKRVPVLSRVVEKVYARWFDPKRLTLLDLDRKCAGRALRAGVGITYHERPRSADMAALVQRIGTAGRIRHVRDREYFDWRFSNPQGRYRFLCQDTAGLEGYLVLHEYASDYLRSANVNLVDWEATSFAGKAALLRAALELLNDRRAVIWTASLDPETIALLEHHRFRAEQANAEISSDAPSILVRSTRGQTADAWELAGLNLTDPANWDLRMLYSMCG